MRRRELDASRASTRSTSPTLLDALERPAADRYDVLLEAFRRGATIERGPRAHARSTPGSCASCRRWRSTPEAPFAGERSFKAVDTCAAEFAASTPYFYSGWERRGRARGRAAATEPSVVILGGGPNRIGQGIEFDYCCVHAAMTVRESGRDAVMVNCNPETVSTDYDTSDRLYFEPLTLEDVLGVIEVEQPEGVIVQFGGQTPLKLAAGLQEAGVPLLGTSVDAIDLAEDRGRFGDLLERLGYEAPPYATAHTSRRRWSAAETVGYPLLVRPSATCSAAARWRSSTPATGCADYLEPQRARRPPDLPRPLPGERDRGRRRRALRRRGRLDRRHHAARRGGRHPLGRQRLRAAAALARRTRCSSRSAPRRAASRSASASSGS